jgi:hypothetical protein
MIVNGAAFERGVSRRSLLAGLACLSPVAGCAGALGSSHSLDTSGLDAEALQEQVDRDQVEWAVESEHFAISQPVLKRYPPVTLLVQGSRQPINLGEEMAPYTKLIALREFAGEHQIETVGNAPTVWLYQWVSRAQGPMIFETGFVVPDGSRCPENPQGYRMKHLGPLKVCSIVYRGPYPAEPNSGWNQIRWAERAKERGFAYTERLYRELYLRDGLKKPTRTRITVVEISVA